MITRIQTHKLCETDRSCGACGGPRPRKVHSTVNFRFRNHLLLYIILLLDSSQHVMILPRAALPPQLSAVARHPVMLCRRIHSSPFRSAVAHPVTAHGPPPKAPDASPEFKEPVGSNAQVAPEVESKRTPKLTAALKKRFWKDVHVNGKSGMDN
jgi:hypothetical protein